MFETVCGNTASNSVWWCTGVFKAAERRDKGRREGGTSMSTMECTGNLQAGQDIDVRR